MTNSGKLFADELTEQLLEAVFIQSECQMSIYYNYAPDGSNIVVLSYVDDCVYWYTKEDVSNSDEQVDKLTREYNIHYRVFIGLLIYLFSTTVYQSFAVQK